MNNDKIKKKLEAFFRDKRTQTALMALIFIAGYKVGFDKVYTAQISYSYRDPSILRYLSGRELDINGNGVYRYLFGKKFKID